MINLINKVQNKGFLFLLFCAIIMSVGYPLYKKYYIKPQEWKKMVISGIKTTHTNVPDSLIIEYCNCIYSSFKSRYGSVDKFPNRKNYTKTDRIDIIECTIDFLIKDSVKKEIARSKLDSLATLL